IHNSQFTILPGLAVTEEDRRAAIAEYIQADAYAAKLGATIEAIEPGYSRVSLTVTEEMVNFHGITHGGIVFSLGDIAFSAAGNSRGQTAVALDMHISFLKATAPGDHLVAEARELHLAGPLGLYQITVVEANRGELVAQIQARGYRKREWFVEP
ncbi:MAG: hotdog fold thioesterase, partial [Anaerolineae bacterium]